MLEGRICPAPRGLGREVGEMTDGGRAIWSQSDTEVYRSLSRYAVPQRERQIEIIVARVAKAMPDGDVLDLCCGEGFLTSALLAQSPDSRVLAYDGSDDMLAETQARAEHSARLVTRRIDLAARDWRHGERPLRAVVSSLAVHHLDAAGKRALFGDVLGMLAPGGVFVLADVVQPATEAGSEISADLWDAETRARSLELDGDLGGFEAFRRADWNHFRHAVLDPVDKPSTVVEHLDWLREAGFAGVDLHWMSAGQMILSAGRPGS